MFILIVFLSLGAACENTSHKSDVAAEIIIQTELDVSQTKGNKIKSRIKTPEGYKRTREKENSYQAYLRELNLKPEGAQVLYFDGSSKFNDNIYHSVIDLEIGNKDLHQCADAIMRLRAEYLWQTDQYDKIHFNFTNGHKVEYSEWMSGKRMRVNGNRTWWVQKETPSNTYKDFWNYLELIFMYAGTASLEKELLKLGVEEARIGDVLIQGGHPGHAVVIVDKAVHEKTGEAIYLLAQSYMPAQEIQILVNQGNPELSPWYRLDKETIYTPEWTFSIDNLRRFGE